MTHGSGEVNPRAGGQGNGRLTFTVQPMVGLSITERIRFDNETDAVETAQEMVGPNVTQVTVEAVISPYKHGTFSLRHFTLKDGQHRDTGWRSWLRGVFVEDMHPDDMVKAVAS